MMDFARNPDHTLMRIGVSPHDIKTKLLPWQTADLTYTATGYGAKIPTFHMIRICNVWRRVYCCIYSNVGTLYVILGGSKIVVDLD
jgi:hypothetical protein